MTSWQFLALISGKAERQSLSTMRISLGGARRSRSRDRRVEMVGGSRRIPSPSLLLIGREKEKKEKHEHVNYLTASVKATGSSATKKMSSCKFMPHKVSREKSAQIQNKSASLPGQRQINQDSVCTLNVLSHFASRVDN